MAKLAIIASTTTYCCLLPEDVFYNFVSVDFSDGLKKKTPQNKIVCSDFLVLLNSAVFVVFQIISRGLICCFLMDSTVSSYD